MKYLMDTHVWVWWNMAPKNLSRTAYALIEDADSYDEMLLSSISPWEFCRLLEKERIAISCNPAEWLSQALELPKLRLVPLTPRLAYSSTVLPRPFHDDPADQIIVATAREENATIISKDKLIRKYRHVRTLW